MSRVRIANRKHPELEPIDLQMMERAIELARRAASADEIPVGAVIYRHGEIIAPVEGRRCPSGGGCLHLRQ